MSGPLFTSLLSPLNIGALTIPNRIVFGAHVTNLGKGNRFGDAHGAYYLARAKGGAGLMVLEGATVHPLDQPYEHIPFAHSDGVLPSLRALLRRLKQAAPAMGCLASLTHAGGQSNGKILRQSPWAPSPVPEVASKRIAREMTAGQIETVTAAFADCAARMRGAGLDGVELNAGQFSLLRQFLSPLTNFRKDAYGGSLENRALFLLRTAAAMRLAMGADAVLGVRLCGDELAPWGGLTLEDAVSVARMLTGQGGVDYLSIQIGGPFSVHMTEAGMPVPEGHAAHLAAAVREGIATAAREGIAAAVPVFADGRLETPGLADEVLERQQADAAVMTRALISDPDLPLKCAGENREPIRPHIGMMRYFSVQGDWNRPIGDLANPRAGREAELAARPPASTPLPMLVIGGGPAGCEAAATLARAGHRVTLHEARGTLGGMAALLGGAVEARTEFERLCRYYRDLLAHLEVEVALNRPVLGFEPGMEAFHALFLADGAEAPEPIMDADLEAAGMPVVSPRRLLESTAEEWPRQHKAAAVADREFGFRMAAAVEWLLQGGWAVDVITADFLVGRELVESAEFLWFNRVAEKGARFHPRLETVSARDGVLTCRDRFSGRSHRFGPLDLVVDCAPEVPKPGLLEKLAAGHPRVITLGDARAPRLMGEAIAHAHRTVWGMLNGQSAAD
ncbi:MAG: FAD-dependent oxidoreductase [bacterium]